MTNIINDLYSFFGIDLISSSLTVSQLIEVFVRVGVGLAVVVLLMRCFFWVTSKF